MYMDILDNCNNSIFIINYIKGDLEASAMDQDDILLNTI